MRGLGGERGLVVEHWARVSKVPGTIPDPAASSWLSCEWVLANAGKLKRGRKELATLLQYPEA